LLIGGLVGLAQELPFPGQQFVQTQCGKIGDTGEDVGEPGLGIDVVKATGCDHRQHDGGTVGATRAAGEGPVAPSQGDASQCALGTIVGQADPAIVEEAGEVVPAPEHVVDRLQDLGGAREGFALTQQPGVHVLEKRLALFLAHGAPLVDAAAVDGALDLEQRIEASDRLQRDRRDRFALLTFPSILLDVSQLEEAPPRMGKAKRWRWRLSFSIRSSRCAISASLSDSSARALAATASACSRASRSACSAAKALARSDGRSSGFDIMKPLNQIKQQIQTEKRLSDPRRTLGFLRVAPIDPG
jgi:hypothetical protein